VVTAWAEAIREAAATGPELDLALRCAASAPHAPAAGAAPVAWDVLVRTADHHGLLPLVASAMASAPPEDVPPDVRSRLAEHAAANALRSRILTEELARLAGELQGRGVDMLTYKGPALARMAYGPGQPRPFADLDVLVGERDLPAVESLLEGDGYTRRPSFMSPARESAYRRAANEHVFLSPDGWIGIDVHWALAPRRFPWRFDLPRMWARAAAVDLGGRTVHTFRPEDHLLVASAHAAKDVWRKLIWARDVDGLVRRHPGLGWDDVLGAAREAHGERMLALALLLAHGLFGTPLPGRVLEGALDQRAMPGVALDVARGAATLHTAKGRFDESLDLRDMHLATCDRWRDRLLYVWRTWTLPDTDDWSRVDLSDRLFGVYYPLRLGRQLLRCLKLAAGHGATQAQGHRDARDA